MADNTRIDELISTLIARSDRHFQCVWIARGIPRERFLSEECGTGACACGWAIMLWGSDEDVEILTVPYGQDFRDVRQARIIQAGRDVLGLTMEQARWIFTQTTWFNRPNEAAIWGLKYVKDHPVASAFELTLAARQAGLLSFLSVVQ